VNDYWCTYNEHDGCNYVKTGVQQLTGQSSPTFWEEDSSCASGGSSSLYGEKKIYLEDVSYYKIKAQVNIDDNSWVEINGVNVSGLQRVCCGWTSWVDVASSYFKTGWNTVKFRAEDTCSGNRYFDMNWDVQKDGDAPVSKITNIVASAPADVAGSGLGYKYNGPGNYSAFLRAKNEGNENITYTVTVEDTDENLDQTACTYSVKNGDEVSGIWIKWKEARPCNGTFTFTVGRTGDCSTQEDNMCWLVVESKDAFGKSSLIKRLEDISSDERKYYTIHLEDPSKWTNSWKLGVDWTEPYAR